MNPILAALGAEGRRELSRRAGAAARKGVLVGLACAAFLVAAGFGVAALHLWIATNWDRMTAHLVVGGGFLALALVLLAIALLSGRSRHRPPPEASATMATVATAFAFGFSRGLARRRRR